MRQIKDKYYQKAKKENFVARSIYKLKEMDEKQGILRKGARVLDLGSSPGSWMQYASQIVGPEGIVIGIDLKPLGMPVPPNAQFSVADVKELAEDESLSENGRFDIIMSDMAPSTMGNRVADSGGSAALCEYVLDIAAKHLKREGIVLFKIFQGPFYNQIVERTKEQYSSVKFLKPKSCRSESKEIYLLATNRQAQKKQQK